MKRFMYLAIFFLFGSSCNYDIDSLVASLASSLSVDCEYVGFAGSPSESYEKFKILKRVATKEKLLELTNHKSDIVKAYASFALIDKDLIEPYELLSKFIDDKETVPTFCGCLAGSQELSSLIYRRYRNNRITYPDEEDYENVIIRDSKELLKMDSLILFSDVSSRWLSSLAFENRIYPERFTPRIEERAFVNKDFYALKYVYQNLKEDNVQKLESAFIEFIEHEEKENDIFFPDEKAKITKLLNELKKGK